MTGWGTMTLPYLTCPYSRPYTLSAGEWLGRVSAAMGGYMQRLAFDGGDRKFLVKIMGQEQQCSFQLRKPDEKGIVSMPEGCFAISFRVRAATGETNTTDYLAKFDPLCTPLCTRAGSETHYEFWDFRPAIAIPKQVIYVMAHSTLRTRAISHSER